MYKERTPQKNLKIEEISKKTNLEDRDRQYEMYVFSKKYGSTNREAPISNL